MRVATLNLSMPDPDKEALLLLKREFRAPSVSEIVREAAPVYALVRRAIRRGARVEIVEPNGKKSVIEIPSLSNPFLDDGE
jgi:hypothetical protein